MSGGGPSPQERHEGGRKRIRGPGARTQEPVENGEEYRHRNRLRDDVEMVRAILKQRLVPGYEARQEDNLDALQRLAFFDLPGDVGPVHARHVDIQKNQLRLELERGLQRQARIVFIADDETPLSLQLELYRFRRERLVVHQQNAVGGTVHGLQGRALPVLRAQGTFTYAV